MKNWMHHKSYIIHERKKTEMCSFLTSEADDPVVEVWDLSVDTFMKKKDVHNISYLSNP